MSFIDQTQPSDLGDTTTPTELAGYIEACHNYEDQEGSTPEEAAAAIWNDGDFWPMVLRYAPDYRLKAQED